VRKKNDFSGDEYKIKEKMSEIFRDMAEEEEIPEPDLSFLDDKGSSGKTEMDPRIKRRRRRERLKNFRRTATVFCAICGVFLLSSGIAVMISNQEAYAGNPVFVVIDRFVTYVKLQQNGKSNYEDERLKNFYITNESDLNIIRKEFPELLIPEVVPEQYGFQHLDVKIYSKGMYTYSYAYVNVLDAEDFMRIDASKREKESQISIFKDGECEVINNGNSKLYCQEDYSTGGITGICLTETQFITISGKLSKEEIIAISESLK